MNNHLRGHLWLFVLTLGIACVVYPLILWVFANVFFPSNAAGSLVKQKGADGKEVVLGSRLIAQPFTKDWYFQPRPSAASYNATASGASNWGANNPKLRDRVARQLGPIVKYDYDPEGPQKDESVQKDIESWFANDVPNPDQPSLVEKWATDYPTLATAWMKSDANRPAVIEWLRAHPEILADWEKSKPDAPKPDLSDDKTIPFDDITAPFFASVARTPAFKNRWLEPKDFETGEKDDQGEPIKGKRFEPVSEGADLQATFFDTWLQAHPDAKLKKVPADMVMASGSGLDPHITLRNATYQLKGVIAARVTATGRDPVEVSSKVESSLKHHTFTPLSGLIGEPLVNVLELNLELDQELPSPVSPRVTP